MKKILLLGGSAQQIVAITTAKRLGFSTVLCDYLPDNPGQMYADRFYQVSTTCKEDVLRVAQAEAVDGVIAYSSDPAAPTAAYVAEAMGLPTNPYQSVNTLCNKDLFRAFLRDHGYPAPQALDFSRREDALAAAERFSYPLIVKPVDSSGSKGVTVLRGRAGLEAALDLAFSFSRGHRIVIEEYIEKKHPYLIGGDILVSDGKVVLWGLMNCHRDPSVNPLVPVGKSYPLLLDADDLNRVKTTLNRLVADFGIRFGGLNVELVIDGKDRVFPIDIGPRCGGNMIPELLGMIFRCDVVEMSVLAAMGEPLRTWPSQGQPSCYATYNLHADRDGIFDGVTVSPELKPYLLRTELYKKPGDSVCFFSHSAHALGICFFRFPSQEIMLDYLEHIRQHIRIELS